MAGKSTKKRKSGRKVAADDRREFLVHLDPALIKSLKLAALKTEVTASSVLETALREWLNRGRAPGDDAESRGEKKQFLAKISVRVLKDIKLAAIDRRVSASSLVAVAVTEWLDRDGARAQSSFRDL